MLPLTLGRVSTPQMTASQDLCVTPWLAVQVSCLRDLPGAKHHSSGQCALKLLLCYRKISSPSQLQRTELCTLPAIKARHILVYTSMVSRSKENILLFDSLFMSLQLEHCVQFGSPNQKMHWHKGESSVENLQDALGSIAHDTWGKAGFS